ncbi:peptidase M1 [Taibaiella sp. KBW10]|uniref:M1 family metallopeptidase n=1 Tax=Taibaiella sp. KBW10 TaxID=2153357 RepID=UPI000F590EAE|nr:M1 family metallopeptidase [Taibaiella sp. KBW10]RQO32159.1 peptidase M1 [Taibaiella sp. KBW10]
MRNKYLFSLLLMCSICFKMQAQQEGYCSDNPNRDWWNVVHYDLKLNLPADTNYISGTVTIRAKAMKQSNGMLQIDLQDPLSIQSIAINGTAHKDYIKTGKSYQITLSDSFAPGDTLSILVNYSGSPQIAKKAPWDGGLIRTTDQGHKPWIAVACQGDGASIWFPCKDFPGDEPELGVDMHYTTDKDLSALGNGRLISKTMVQPGMQEWHWRVSNPINLYDITFYIGDYIHWKDTLKGLEGSLDIDYFVLNGNEAKARKQFSVVKPMLHAFEHWMGPYPFYKDGYKLIEAPYLGMEHQSAVAYGNQYKMGYLGKDRSKTGVGLLFDFIIVHESGHEWYGNNISANDVAYSWIHEGFTTYTETILTEALFGRKKAFEYQRGCWALIKNDRPMEGKPGLCDGGSGDHYVKGSAMIHMIRMMMRDENKFQALLRQMNLSFRHQTVSGKEMETFIEQETKMDLRHFFEQYLRQTSVPELQIEKNKTGFSYQWRNCIDGFDMPVLVYINRKPQWINPSTTVQVYKQNKIKSIGVSPDFYITKDIR